MAKRKENVIKVDKRKEGKSERNMTKRRERVKEKWPIERKVLNGKWQGNERVKAKWSTDERVK